MNMERTAIYLCICRILGWYFTTEYSAQEGGCAFVVLGAGRDPSPRSSPLNVSNDVALVHLSLSLFQSMIVRGVNECL